MNAAVDVGKRHPPTCGERIGLMELLGELSPVFSSMALRHGK
jgi:hypothetical protein